MIGFGTRRLSAILLFGFVLCVGAASTRSADGSQPPDLTELRDAVTTASKRGENVDEIRTALEALERALAKGWTAPKPGAPVLPSAELAELRRTVEAAAKKGENVEAITKELALVEKILTGRAFARLDKTAAGAYATEVLKGVDLLATRYYRELNKNELIDRAVDGLYLAAGEKTPDAVKQERARRAKDAVIDGRRLLEGARESIGARTDLADQTDVMRTLQHVCGVLDGQTAFMTPEAMTRMRSQQYLNGLGEVGVQVRRTPNRGIEVVTPYKDSPAYKADIRAGDAITQFKVLDDAEGKPLATPAVFAPDALKDEDLDRILWGKPNSRVELTVRRPGAEPAAVTLTLVRVKRECIHGNRRNADDTWDHLLDEKHGIYYIRLLDFQRADLASELAQLVTKLEGQNLKGLVLDLRFGGSGLIDTAIGVADLFVDDPLIVEFRGRTNGSDRKMGHRPGSRLAFPMVCLVNASAGTCTEIIAACLQDHKRALIVGERTTGRAGVQNYYPLTWGALRVTTTHAHRPNGKPLDRAAAPAEHPDDWGVTPDAGHTVNLTNAERDDLSKHLEARRIIARRDPAKPEPAPAIKDQQLNKALDYLRTKTKPE